MATQLMDQLLCGSCFSNRHFGHYEPSSENILAEQRSLPSPDASCASALSPSIGRLENLQLNPLFLTWNLLIFLANAPNRLDDNLVFESLNLRLRLAVVSLKLLSLCLEMVSLRL